MNENSPIISVCIPTYNSESTIANCLKSIIDQSFLNYEIIVVDGGSSDRTTEIVKNFGARVINDKNSLLEARVIGILEARGQFILLLDSDQILLQSSLERCLVQMKDNDMLCLGERAAITVSTTQKLMNASKTVSQSNPEKYLNPFSGLLIPRFFNADLLKLAVRQIPPIALEIVFDRDHQIIYYEAWKISKKIKFVDNVLFHEEPEGFTLLLRKAYRWGYTAGFLRSAHLYDQLLKEKVFIRTMGDGIGSTLSRTRLVMAANLITFLKGLPYVFGYLLGFLKGEILG